MNNISSLSALRVFVRVAETGSISGAGRSLGLSSTAASRRIQDLEAALKVSLVNRSTRHVGLTEAGMYFYRHVDKFLKDLDATCASVTEMHDGPSGVLRIASRRSFGLHLVVPSLQSFRERYPQITIQLKFIEAPDTAPRDGIDLVLRLGAPAEKTLVAHKLASARCVLCASPAYLKKAPPFQAPADLAAHACLGYRLDNNTPVWVFDWKDARQEIPADGPVQSDSESALRLVARDGMGIALLPYWLVADDLSAGRLVECLPGVPVSQAGYWSDIYAVFRRSEFVPIKITAFIDHIADFIGRSAADLPELRE